MKVLVAGGAGYIGSHLVNDIKDKHDVVVMDNLSKGHRQAVTVPLEIGDIRNKDDLERIFSKHKPDAVFHFCASIEAGESMTDPLKYYDNNVCGTIALLQAMQKHKTKYFIFSSTAALFGNPVKNPIDVDDLKLPINPYGQTKLAVEQMLDCSFAFATLTLAELMKMAIWFGNLIQGEDHDPETHIIPIVLQVPLGKRDKVFINGEDYNTHDGSCIRDYVHVSDLANAHIMGLDYLQKNNKSERFNLGSGKGFSVKEIIEAARKVTGHPIPAEIRGRRPGDPDCLVASSEKAFKLLGWKPKYESIESIIATAWKYHKNHPNGFQ